MKLVLDTSVALKFYLPEILEDQAAKLLESDCRFHVPELIYPEFSNIICKKVKWSELSEEEGREIVTAFMSLELTTRSNRGLIMSAYSGAIATGDTVYDWTYLALAVSLSCKLVTADRRFFDTIGPTPLRKNMLWLGDV